MKGLSAAQLCAVCCISLAGALAPLSAQVILSPGDQIRVTSVDAVHVGTFVGLDEDQLHLANGQPGVISLSAIERVEVMTMKTEFARSMAITIGVVAVGFGALCKFSSSSCFATDGFKEGAQIGAFLGIPLGALVGVMARYERWEPVLTPLHDAQGSGPGQSLSMSLTPLAIDRVAFRMALSVGGSR